MRNRPVSIRKAGHDDGRSNERPSEAPDAVGCDRRPAQAVDPRRDLSGRLAAAPGRAGRGLWREPHSGARSAVSARGRRAGAYRPAKGRDRLGAVAGRNQRRVRSARDHGAAAAGAIGAALYGTGFDGLDDIQKHFEKAIKAGNVSEWGQLNADFHMALYIHARRPRTKAIVIALLQTSDRYTRLQLSNTKAMGTAEKEHAHLIALCRAQKIDEACRFLAQHIEAVRTDLLQRRRWRFDRASCQKRERINL